MRLPDPRAWWPPAVLVAGGWVVAGLAAGAADAYDSAPAWLLLVNLVVLLPAAVAAVYAIGLALGGPLLAAWFGAVLVLLPLGGWLYALVPYRDTYVDVVLVEATGVADGGRFAAGALLAVSAALVLRRPLAAAALAGAAAGAAVLVEPSACLFLAGPPLAYALLRRPAQLAAFAVPAAAGALLALALRDVGVGVEISREAFGGNMAGLREYLWSNRLLQWLPLAGAVGLARRSPAAAALAGGWFGAFALAEGASPNLSVTDGTFLVAFVPALPALALLAAAVPLLVPGVPARLAGRVAAPS